MAMMRNGDRPKAAMRRMIRQEKPPQVSRTGMLFLRRERSTKAQEAIWESTVARAAPATSRWSTKIKMGSRTILITAPSITVAMPRPEKPWQMRKLFIPVAIRAKKVPRV